MMNSWKTELRSSTNWECQTLSENLLGRLRQSVMDLDRPSSVLSFAVYKTYM